MKWLLLAGIVFIVATYSMRKRREAEARAAREYARRGESLYDTDVTASHVRSADNVRLVSDTQLDEIEKP